MKSTTLWDAFAAAAGGRSPLRGDGLNPMLVEHPNPISNPASFRPVKIWQEWLHTTASGLEGHHCPQVPGENTLAKPKLYSHQLLLAKHRVRSKGPGPKDPPSPSLFPSISHLPPSPLSPDAAPAQHWPFTAWNTFCRCSAVKNLWHL